MKLLSIIILTISVISVAFADSNRKRDGSLKTKFAYSEVIKNG